MQSMKYAVCYFLPRFYGLLIIQKKCGGRSATPAAVIICNLAFNSNFYVSAVSPRAYFVLLLYFISIYLDFENGGVALLQKKNTLDFLA